MDYFNKRYLHRPGFMAGLFYLAVLVFSGGCRHNPAQEVLFTDTLTFDIPDTSSPREPATTPRQAEEQNIYYGIYSPAEVSEIFNSKNISYNPDILSPRDHLPALTTTARIAINLGIYGADFSYAHLFQSADAAKYLGMVLKLSEKLGIPPEYIRTLTKRLDFNISNPDSLVQITLEAFNHINRFLIEEDQGNLAYLIAAGAWVEAMYIAAHELLEKNDPEIIKKIIEQKYSLEYLLSTMKNYYLDTNVAYFYRRMYVLSKYLNKTEIVFNKEQFTIDKEKKTISSSGNKIYYSKDNIEKIREIIFSLRNLALNE